MAKKTIEDIVAAVNTASVAFNKAKADLETAVSNEEVGAFYIIDKIPHEVVEDKGQKVLKCAMNKRQIAMLRGEKPPAVRKRTKTAEAAE